MRRRITTTGWCEIISENVMLLQVYCKQMIIMLIILLQRLLSEYSRLLVRWLFLMSDRLSEGWRDSLWDGYSAS